MPTVPMGFNVGPIFVHYYAIVIMIGALAAAWLSEREARWRGEDSEKVWDGLLWVLIGGIIGARIWHILTPPPSMVAMGITTSWYLSHPLDMIATWKGGLGIPGAVIGGALALFLFCRRYKLIFTRWIDIVAPALPLGQAIGRWGNYFNQELYGQPSNLPWAVHIDPAYRLQAYASQATYHPIFLYESLWNLANVGFLLWLSRRQKEKLHSGDLFLIYLVTYPLGRFFLDFLRLDASQIGGLNANQALMVVVALAAAVTLVVRHRRPASLSPVEIPSEDKPLNSDETAEEHNSPAV